MFWKTFLNKKGEILSNFKCRSSHPEVFCKKSVLSIFAKFTEKRLCQSIFFNKVTGLRPASLLKKRLWHMCFPVKFVKFLRTSFLTEHLQWLLLEVAAINLHHHTLFYAWVTWKMNLKFISWKTFCLMLLYRWYFYVFAI